MHYATRLGQLVLTALCILVCRAECTLPTSASSAMTIYLPNASGCANIVTGGKCNACLEACWSTLVHCTFVCQPEGWDSGQCKVRLHLSNTLNRENADKVKNCTAHFDQKDSCSMCIPGCFRGSICVNCHDPVVQSQMSAA